MNVLCSQYSHSEECGRAIGIIDTRASGNCKAINCKGRLSLDTCNLRNVGFDKTHCSRF